MLLYPTQVKASPIAIEIRKDIPHRWFDVPTTFDYALTSSFRLKIRPFLDVSHAANDLTKHT